MRTERQSSMKKIFNSRALALILVLAMTLAMFTIGASATTISKVSIAEGEPVAIDWTQAGTTYTGTIVNSATLSSTVYSMPSSFTLWTEGEATFEAGTGITVTAIGASADETNYSYKVDVSGIASGSTATLVVTISSGTYTVALPSATPISVGGTKPTSVLSYAPLGQFARGNGWGSIYSNYANVAGSTASDALVKFATGTGYESTGVSLGAFGGYIDFYFQGGITNDAKNPYGVDFVIYGNAFNANPEAGAVQVSEDGITWYELAGSMYYDGNFNYTGEAGASRISNAYTGTLRNATISYSQDSVIKATVKDASGATKINAAQFVASTAWWPTVLKGYPAIAAHINSNATSTSNVQVTCNDTVFSSTGVTLIPDSNTTADYAFGYADVTPNGSPATYGDAVNPYKPYNYTENGTAKTKTGGDGFDLEWAVDITTGLPVDVTDMTFRYVRVYSAVLDNGMFGETSTEICGIFTTANKATTSVNRTAAPTSLKIGDDEIDNLADFGMIEKDNENYGGVVYYDASSLGLSSSTITVSASSNANVYINSNTTGSYEKTSDVNVVRVIVQEGTSAPYIAIIKF